MLGQEKEQEGQERLEEKSRLIAFLAEQAAAALYRVNLSGRLRANHLETVLALAKALEARDIHTAGHGQGMMELAEKIAVAHEIFERRAGDHPLGGSAARHRQNRHSG